MRWRMASTAVLVEEGTDTTESNTPTQSPWFRMNTATSAASRRLMRART